ncbi:MAG: hypothetical protein ACYDHY_07855 [Acidiferrobacterales bacterium]
MANLFIIRGLAPGLDGLLAESDDSLDLDDSGNQLLSIAKLRNHNIMQGDREVSVTLPVDAMYISSEYLQPTDDPGKREFDHVNTHGKLISEDTFHTAEVGVVLADFENLLSVSVMEIVTNGRVGRTVFSQNFINPVFREKARAIAHSYKNNVTKDLHDIVFEFKELEEEQSYMRSSDHGK